MSRKRAIIKGTFILTLTGFATRFMGFFYRVFLSHTFGEEGVGLYQLIFPIYALCFSLTSAGIEIALSRCVAKRTTLGQEKEARELLYTSIVFTVIISCITTLLLQKYAWFISSAFLKDDRCAELLVILSYAFPFAAVHSCICGYYFGLKMTGVPATSQLIEQVARITSVYLIYVFGQKNGVTFGISIAVAGLIAGEVISSLFCLKAVTGRSISMRKIRPALPSFGRNMRELLFLSIPLTGSRVLLNVLQSVEAISIPLRLQAYGMTNKAALSTYGVLTGMALPCILFPSAITNSISTMLLPTVAEIQALDNQREMSAIIKKVVSCCVLLGSGCCALLLLTGSWIGSFLFHSPAAGSFIVTLAWICPFLYTDNTLISIINGIGKTTLSFVINAVGLLIRIGSVLLLIPVYGIRGYLWGLLASQLCIFLFCIFYLYYYLAIRRKKCV